MTAKTVQAAIDHLDRIVGAGADDIRPAELAPLRTHLVGIRDEPDVVARVPLDAVTDTPGGVYKVTGQNSMHTAVQAQAQHREEREWLSRCYCRPAALDPTVDRAGQECNKCGTTWVPAVLVMGRVDTGHYLFEALDYSVELVERRLLDAYAAHAARNPYADPDLMAERIEDGISWTELRVGQAAIDGDPVTVAP